jgi:hypothetical protein
VEPSLRGIYYILHVFCRGTVLKWDLHMRIQFSELLSGIIMILFYGIKILVCGFISQSYRLMFFRRFFEGLKIYGWILGNIQQLLVQWVDRGSFIYSLITAVGGEAWEMCIMSTSTLYSSTIVRVRDRCGWEGSCGCERPKKCVTTWEIEP